MSKFNIWVAYRNVRRSDYEQTGDFSEICYDDKIESLYENEIKLMRYHSYMILFCKIKNRQERKGYRHMNLIAAVDENWAIGNKNSLLIRIPADQKAFRQETIGKVVVLGRKTLETFPQGLPLKDRTNIILSSNQNYQVKDAIVVHNVDELMEELKRYPDEHVYIIGGESVYRQMLPYCNVAHITKIDRAYEADAYFPNLDEMPEWEITADSDEQVYFDTTYHFLKYERKNK